MRPVSVRSVVFNPGLPARSTRSEEGAQDFERRGDIDQYRGIDASENPLGRAAG